MPYLSHKNTFLYSIEINIKLTIKRQLFELIHCLCLTIHKIYKDLSVYFDI